MIRKLPKDGTIRRKRAFAWLPVKTDDGYHLWFDYYTRVERYCGFNDMWVLQKRLSRGSQIMTDYIKYEVEVYEDGDKHWYLNGKLHREDGPAVERSNGFKYWYLNGKPHREDGPAREWADGSKAWYLNGKLHREDGPAVEYSDGTKSWYLNGQCHREDGPAVERSNGYKAWYLNGKHLTEEAFNKRMTPTVEMTMAQISEALGKNVKVVK
jgi:hypothetical protein